MAFDGGRFEKNRSLTGDGGGLALVASVLATDLQDTLFKANTAGGSGGAIFHGGGTLSLEGVDLLGNIASFHGGGLATISAGSLTVNDSLVQGNRATHGSGGGFHLAGAGAKTITASDVLKNKAGFEGGGVFLALGGLTLDTTVVSGNAAVFRGGGTRNATAAPIVFLGLGTVSGNTAAIDPNTSGL